MNFIFNSLRIKIQNESERDSHSQLLSLTLSFLFLFPISYFLFLISYFLFPIYYSYPLAISIESLIHFYDGLWKKEIEMEW
jgi:hypothetical protein